MKISRRLAPAFVCIGTLVSACSKATESPSVPAGLHCTVTKSASDTARVNEALSGAAEGTCVVLTGSTYSGPFNVPAGVALVAEDGARATIRSGPTGTTTDAPSVTMGEGAHLANVDVVDALGVGVAIRATRATVAEVNVTGAKSAALAILCSEDAMPGCSTGAVTLTNVTLSKSALGLWISGAHVVMNAGSSHEHGGTSLSSSAGVVVQAGAQLDMDGVRVEKNQGAGIIVDGAQTKASFKHSVISENGERGLWAQGVLGTMDAPSIRLDDCELVKNKIVGVGALESRGIIIVGGRVAETISAPVMTDLGRSELVGDGIGLFRASDFRLDGTAVEANARTAGIVDGSDRGIIIVGGRIGAGPTGFKFVVQDTTNVDLQIPEADRSVLANKLGVSTPMLAVPPALR